MWLLLYFSIPGRWVQSSYPGGRWRWRGRLQEVPAGHSPSHTTIHGTWETSHHQTHREPGRRRQKLVVEESLYVLCMYVHMDVCMQVCIEAVFVYLYGNKWVCAMCVHLQYMWADFQLVRVRLVLSLKGNLSMILEEVHKHFSTWKDMCIILVCSMQLPLVFRPLLCIYVMLRPSRPDLYILSLIDCVLL